MSEYNFWTGQRKGISSIFYYSAIYNTQVHLGDGGYSDISLLSFDVHRGFPIYGNSDTVQPPAINLNFYIKAK